MKRKLAAAIAIATIANGADAQTGCPQSSDTAATERIMIAPTVYGALAAPAQVPITQGSLLASQTAQIGFLVGDIPKNPEWETIVGSKSRLFVTQTRFGALWCWWDQKGEPLKRPPTCLTVPDENGAFTTILTDAGGANMTLTPLKQPLLVAKLPFEASRGINGFLNVERRIEIASVDGEKFSVSISYKGQFTEKRSLNLTPPRENQTIPLRPGTHAIVGGLTLELTQSAGRWIANVSGKMTDWARAKCSGNVAFGDPEP